MAVSRRSSPCSGSDVAGDCVGHDLLRGKLMTAGRDRFLCHQLAGGQSPGEVSEQPLWWPPTKIAGSYLFPYFFDRDEVDSHEAAGSAAHRAVQVPLYGMR